MFCHCSCSLARCLDIESLELRTSPFNQTHAQLVQEQGRVSVRSIPFCTYWTNEPWMKWVSREGRSHFSSCHYGAWLTLFSQIREMRLPLFQVRQKLDRKCQTSFVHQEPGLGRTPYGGCVWTKKWLPVRRDEWFVQGLEWKSMTSARPSRTCRTCARVMLRLREYSGHDVAEHMWLNFC